MHVAPAVLLTVCFVSGIGAAFRPFSEVPPASRPRGTQCVADKILLRTASISDSQSSVESPLFAPRKARCALGDLDRILRELASDPSWAHYL